MSEQEQDQIENEELETETQEQEEHRDDEQPDTEEAETEEFFIGIEGEEPQQQEDPFRGEPAPEWVKDLRKKERENQKRIKELESELSVHRKPAEIDLGEKPTLESVGYDTDEFDRQITDWYAKKAQYEQQEQAKKAEQEKANKSWQDRVSNYEAKKSELKTKHKVRDFDEAEEVARGTLNELQQNMIVMGAKQPELLIYHLGTNPEKAKKLASITDPIQFAFEAGSLDHQLKVQTRKPQTSPERKVAGSGSLSGTTDSTLEKLRAEAEKTGDYTKVNQYKRTQKQNKD
ncbi:hypothetical protein [Acinetobacter sp. ANC 3882]|uniref:hypothetical protein n=1 Tax=Acinetobacter sp. ANC 3882 TaxID=2923423 RepID=UPI001F4B28C3|nr:hypothetical protein [Acinetobacter sp. ANC 3882]MCH7312901.1 hypothetical protein [Acinetobacter sp. ANC 3882]